MEEKYSFLFPTIFVEEKGKRGEQEEEEDYDWECGGEQLLEDGCLGDEKDGNEKWVSKFTSLTLCGGCLRATEVNPKDYQEEFFLFFYFFFFFFSFFFFFFLFSFSFLFSFFFFSFFLFSFLFFFFFFFFENRKEYSIFSPHFSLLSLSL